MIQTLTTNFIYISKQSTYLLRVKIVKMIAIYLKKINYNLYYYFIKLENDTYNVNTSKYTNIKFEYFSKYD